MPLTEDDSLPTFTDYIASENLNQDEIVYLFSDETTHIWINEYEDSLFMVDAGAPPLVNGISYFLTTISTIKNLYIFITHFHIDHVQSLAGLILNSQEYLITVYFHESIVSEFAGWYLDAYPLLITNS